MPHLTVIVAAVVLMHWTVSSYAHAGKLQSSYSECMSQFADQEACLEEHGRTSWHPANAGDADGRQSCALTADILAAFDAIGSPLSWKLLFFNERCRRLELPYYAGKEGDGGVVEGQQGISTSSGSADLADALTAILLRADDPVVYRDEKFPLSWSYPSSWKAAPSAHSETRLRIVSNGGVGPEDCSVNAIGVPSAKGLSSAQYVDYFIENKDHWMRDTSENLSNYKLLEFDRSFLSNSPAVYSEFTFTYKTASFDIPMQAYQHSILSDSVVYTITCRAEIGSSVTDLFRLIASGFVLTYLP